MATNTKTRTELKQFFVKNAIPTQGNFADLIDGQLNQSDDGVFKLPDQPLGVVAVAGEQRRALPLYSAYPAPNPDWLISLNPKRIVGFGSGNVAGFGVADLEGRRALRDLTLAADLAARRVEHDHGRGRPAEGALDREGHVGVDELVARVPLALDSGNRAEHDVIGPPRQVGETHLHQRRRARQARAQ